MNLDEWRAATFFLLLGAVEPALGGCAAWLEASFCPSLGRLGRCADVLSLNLSSRFIFGELRAWFAWQRHFECWQLVLKYLGAAFSVFFFSDVEALRVAGYLLPFCLLLLGCVGVACPLGVAFRRDRLHVGSASNLNLNSICCVLLFLPSKLDMTAYGAFPWAGRWFPWADCFVGLGLICFVGLFRFSGLGLALGWAF
ncbi:hypothetical protein OIU85_004716 [Salix viminalis]|uniref:Uncharacterized protein n=1 Tax=Salix viminalis TaxID=40686 RepID=A0A9Q0PTT2_SALVM|nr:hypothetical protein OIU85_004716 [Salix viminalis]